MRAVLRTDTAGPSQTARCSSPAEEAGAGDTGPGPAQSRPSPDTHTVMLRSGHWSPKVPPCSLKVMRFQTAMTVSSGM